LFSHPSFGRLWPLLNLKILVVAPLRLRFYSIVTAKSVSKYGVIPEKLIYGQALSISLISLQIFAVMQLFPWFFDRIDGKYIVHTQMFDKFYLGQTLQKMQALR
jgi:hypothetical protein